jgi:poly-gamma-glutamate synthesis protein (capsule biosynthesis protein)
VGILKKILAVSVIALVVLVLMITGIVSAVNMFSKPNNNSDSNKGNNNTTMAVSNTDTKTQDGTATFTAAFFGDLLIHDAVYNSAKTGNTYDFTNQFSAIGPYLKKSDFICGNLETTFAGKAAGYSNYPNFNCPEQLGITARDVLGVSLLSTVNNHSLDKGYAGLVSTLDFLDSYGVPHTGTARSVDEQNKNFMKDVNGVKLTVLSYTYGINGISIPAGKEYAVNLIDKDKIKADIDRAYAEGADVVIPFLHWGIEYHRVETDDQKALATWIFENTNASIIIGSHPHVVEPIDQITVTKDDKQKTGIVAYSLGNFTGAQNDSYTDSGIIAEFSLTYDFTGKNLLVNNVKYIPTYIDRNTGTKFNYRTVNINKAMKDYENGSDPLISKTEYNKMKSLKDAYAKAVPAASIVSEDDII